MGALQDIARDIRASASLSSLAGGFALWASVSEGRGTRWESSRDLAVLTVSAALGAALTIFLTPFFDEAGGGTGRELTLALGAFLVGYLKRFGILGAGVGSQLFIGQLLAYTAGPRRCRRPSRPANMECRQSW